MSRLSRRVLALVVALLACAPGAAVAGPRTGCAQGRTLLQSDELRVFRASQRRDQHVYGCLNGRRPIRALGFAPMASMAIAGHFFANAYPPFEDQTPQIVVRNARYPVSLWHYYGNYPRGCPSACPADYEHSVDELPAGVTSMVVTRRGRAAWIEGWVLPDGRTRYDVVRTFPPPAWKGAVGHEGKTEQVDWGTDVDPESLHMSGKDATWTKAGVERSVDLA